MFVLNLKIKNSKKVIISLLVSAVVIASATVFLKKADFTPKITTATSDEVSQYSLKADDKQQRLEFFCQLDIKVDEKTEICDSVRIPDNFNAVYDEYNALQRKIGLDLRPYSGKTAERFTYRVKDSGNCVVLLIYKGNVIGGHITDGIWGSRNYPLF